MSVASGRGGGRADGKFAASILDQASSTERDRFVKARNITYVQHVGQEIRW